MFRHFPLHPETPAEGLTLEQFFAGRSIDLHAAQQRMTRLMQEEGLPYGERTHTFNSRLAQELAAWADTQPGGEAIHDHLFRAYFVDGLNPALTDVLLNVAAKAELSVDAARIALENRQLRMSRQADWTSFGSEVQRMIRVSRVTVASSSGAR